ncbi:CBS domain-containing protein [Natrialbaceae archaeon AArc-T1-2]|uniref:CBS domain-containing protein n=1 Tax=Natrialbaceae archaeon AArc-T1-2 TaxID=3053904 RepID=UPI00255A9980|nr:CBS domain-containing protein [Natrialbaceae archaeon AArc-T1-2]WIV68596.1 CBS domain-containing protein [Natrialbaceae archaeon AArc-T1-2]
MDDIFVARLMSTDLRTISPDTLVEDAAEAMLTNDVSSLIVVDDDGGLDGILTTTDFVGIVAESHPKAETPVSRYMTTDVVTTTANTPIRDVADTITEHGFHHVPVVDEAEGVIGMLSTADLAAYLAHVQTPEPV